MNDRYVGEGLGRPVSVWPTTDLPVTGNVT